MSSSKIRWQVFGSPLFVSALFALLVNDHLLKYQFPGWLTGKLSDFAGLFVFAQFFFAFFPEKSKAIVCITAAAFVYWKSPLSQPLIDGWNSLAIVPVARTIDPSDLVALVALPVARLHFLLFRNTPLKKTLAYPVAVIAIFGIMGTSVAYPRRSLQLQLENEPLLSLNQIYRIVEDVADQYHLKCFECSPNKTHRRYQGKDQWLDTNFDNYTQTLFLDLSGRDEKGVSVAAEQLKAAIWTRLMTTYRNVAVKSYQPESHEAWIQISLEAKLNEAQFPFLCPVRDANPELISLLGQLDGYAEANGYADFTQHSCTLSSDLCRRYLTGRVTGPYEFSRSTSVSVDAGCALGADSVKIDIEQKIGDKTVDLSRTVAELRDLVERVTGKGVVVKSSWRDVAR